MKRLFATLRLIVALSIAVAVVATFFDTASRATINPFNFFGYFTMQTNIFTAIVLGLTAFAAFYSRRQSTALVLARACAATYMFIVGIVYNTLLGGLPGGVELPWANNVLHVWAPIYVAVDWFAFGDRPSIPWRRYWIVLAYPIVWLVIVLVRGATDGWVPYPFLDPASGYDSVALFAIVIALGFAAFGALVWAISRVRIVKP